MLVSADGGFVVHDTPQVGDTNTYTLTYDGGTSYLPVTASAKVQVSRAAPGLSVATDAKSYHPGATTKVTAHLGTTYNSRSVTLYAHPVGKARTRLKGGAVDAHGNLAASYKASRNTVFSAVFNGDDRYAPRTVTAIATVTPTVRTVMQYPLGTTRIGSTTYQVFYKSEGTMGFSVRATPGQSNGCATMYVEQQTKGAWHRIAAQSCTVSTLDGWYNYTRALKLFPNGGRFRVRGHYMPPAKSAQTTDVWSPWTYFTVRPGSKP